MLFIFLSSLKPLTIKIVKFTVYAILTCIGISWNSFFSSFLFIKNISEYILYLTGLDNNILKGNVSIEQDKFSYLYLASLILLGVSVAGLLVILIDNLNPDLTRFIPYLSNILDGFYNLCSNT
jgi:hypothetical protein